MTGCSRQIPQSRAEHGLADLLGVLDDAVLAHGGDGRQRGGASQRMPAVRQPAGEHALVERGRDLLTDDDAAERYVPELEPFAKMIRSVDTPVVDGQPLASAPNPP